MLDAAGGAAGLLLMAATFDGSATVQAGFAQAAAQLCLASARARWAGGGVALEVGTQLKAAGHIEVTSFLCALEFYTTLGEGNVQMNPSQSNCPVLTRRVKPVRFKCGHPRDLQICGR